MEKKHGLAGLRPRLWAAVVIALAAAATALFRPAQPVSYADAVYVTAEVAL